ncbi:ABC transporter permease [Occultella glacieicola]|uniref:ABC transporter permease n=1 Tax=Occultella glacieicola TaxID=2518684 RepID=A0ABY2E299_9MICO|nr:ABC transporter permease [Occultella glacieicola]TDE92729.1 ABC transporter permease [Occultella glacieicola]
MNWVGANLDLVVELTLTHARLSIVPILVGFVVAVPLGVFAWRFRWARGVTLTVVGLLYTIPSLALFVLLPPIIGISFLSELNVTIALSIYAVALMTRSATEALESVDPAVRGAANAMGYSGWGRFWAVDLPLAGPVLLAGLRVVSVSTVSLVTVGVLVGSRNLGYLFMNGLQRGIVAEIATGIVMTVLIAVAFDLLLALVGRLAMPWTQGAGGGRRSRRVARRIALTEGPT